MKEDNKKADSFNLVYLNTESEPNNETTKQKEENVISKILSNNEKRNIKKNFDRKGFNFYNVDSVYTSNNADYKNNIWDKGHLAPAGSFSDTEGNLRATFSFLNCVLQHYYLNRNEWAQLEGQVRDWVVADNADIDVRIDIIFDYGHQILPTGAHVPSAFKKTLNFANGTKKCFYFPNAHTNGKDWTEFEISCN